MKTAFALTLLVLTVNGHLIPIGTGSYNATELVKEEGYPVQTLFVETEDGYKLEITRIPGKQDEKDDINKRLKAGGNVQTGKSVVLLMHGIFGDSSEFLINSQNSIAYLLADEGYDVFIGNFRGARNSDDHHSRLSGHKDRAFWDYCFDDMGTKDLPAVIDKVLGITNQHKLHYIGFNQANTALYVLLSQKPEYNNRIEKAVALAPLLYTQHTRNPFLQFISNNYRSSAWVTKWLGSNQLIPSEEFRNHIHQTCMAKHGKDSQCGNYYFLMNGFGQAYESSVAMKFAQAYPSKTSTKEVLHYARLTKSDKFGPFNSDDEEYDLNKITTPIILVSVPRDLLCDERDVDELHNNLPNVVEHIKINDYSSNLDLILDTNVKAIVYEKIVKKLHENH